MTGFVGASVTGERAVLVLGEGGARGQQTDDPINGNCDGSLSACMTAVTLFEGCLQDFMT